MGGNLAKNSPCNRTELTIQFVFTLAIIINFYTYIPTLHVAALIILFKCLTNFPKERILEEQVNPVNQEEGEHPEPKKHIGGWKRRRKKKVKEATWKCLKCITSLILTILIGIYISYTLIKYGSPNSPRQTLYSLAHDPIMVNLKGTDFPIKRATTTRDRTKIRKDIKNMVTSILKLLRSTLKIIQDIINVRNENIRTITKKVIRGWTHLLGDRISTENTRTYWSPTKCEDCDLCNQRGPKPICPYCCIELIGLIEYIKATMKLIISIPYEILKSAAWIHIKHLLSRALSNALITLIHQESTPYTGLLLRILTTAKRYMQNQDEITGRGKKPT